MMRCLTVRLLLMMMMLWMWWHLMWNLCHSSPGTATRIVDV